MAACRPAAWLAVSLTTKPRGQETLGNISCPHYFHFMKGGSGLYVCVGGGVPGLDYRYKSTAGAQEGRVTVYKPWLCNFHLGGDLERFQTKETS